MQGDMSCSDNGGHASVVDAPMHVARQVDLPAAGSDAMAILFAEELGLLLEVAPEHEEEVAAAYRAAGLPVAAIGCVSADSGVSIAVGGQHQISGARA